jgi:alkylated DNA repair dioxygenase AlkB
MTDSKSWSGKDSGTVGQPTRTSRCEALGLTRHELADGSLFWSGHLPEEHRCDRARFAALWALHPADYHTILMHGRLVKTPRFQRAYGADYHYTGNTNRALPVPAAVEGFHAWCREAIDPRLNGILLNWYDGQLGHYVGRHRDSTANMIEGAPIVTISLGEGRRFRLRPWKAKGKVDFAAEDGTLFVLPYATNLAWTHEVPASKRLTGRRISITLRAFEA